LLLIPGNVVYGVFLLFAIIFTFFLSFTAWTGWTPISELKFTGLVNYTSLPKDDTFILSLRNTVIFTLVLSFGQLILGFFTAISLHYYFSKKARSVFSAIYFSPTALSYVIVGLLWSRILRDDGLLNQILHSIGLRFLERGWLSDPSLVLWSTIGVGLWFWFGWNTLFYLAGLQSIPEDMLDAATIDGASDWQTIIHVIAPNVKTATSINLVTNLIGGLTVFSLIYVLTKGGPAHASEVLGTYIYYLGFSAWGPSRLGYASAITVLLSLVAMLLSYLYLRFFHR
jgi:raffinose/stachyose/melibiose transport system permease protein